MTPIRKVLVYALLLLIALTTVWPLVWMVFTSLHSPAADPPTPGRLFSPQRWQFIGWQGDLAGPDAETTLVMDRPRSVTAHFERVSSDVPRMAFQPRAESPMPVLSQAVYRLTVLTQGLGSVTLEPAIENNLYPAGAIVRLRAAGDPGWHPENYWYVLTFPELPVWRFAVNSVAVTVGVVLFQLTICSLAAFAFARLEFRGRNLLFFVYLLTMMVPAQVMIVPLFALVQRLGWLDSYAGLIFPYPYLSTAFGTFLLRQFFVTIPRSLDDAARLDGCGELGVLWHVILPSAKPALATVAAFAFIWTWTDFYWPTMATSSTDMRTLEAGLSIFRDAYGGMRWSLQMAAAVIVLAPVLAFFLVLQRYFVRGVVMSGVKG